MRSDPALQEPLIGEGRIESTVSLTEGRPFAHDFACGATYRSLSPKDDSAETS
jgi:hypothetical protein